jgi:protein-tyrosine phosphatase
MDMISTKQWAPEQLRRLDLFDVPRCVDVHCHCLPGLDDGPDSLDDAVALCRELVRDGFTTVVATPHQLGLFDRLNSAARIRQTTEHLAAELDRLGIPLELLPGSEVRVDERLLKLLDAGDIGTIANANKHLLLELPYELYVDPLPLIGVLRQRGIQAIMSHPERHRYLGGSLDIPRAWIEGGAILQVTASSLLGDFGRSAYRYAWALVQAGLVSLVATDAHDATRRPPRMTAALERLVQEIGEEPARRICLENPMKVVASSE